MPRHVRRLFVVIACLAGAWTLALTIAGGFDVAIFGFRLRSSDPARPLWMGVAALALYFAAGGRVGPAEVRAAASRLGDTVSRRSAWLAALIAIGTMAVSMAFSTRTAASSDVYGYVSQADLWIGGQLKVPEPWAGEVPWRDKVWTFTPLGHRPAPGGELAIVPTYSPGLPMLLAIAKVSGGQCALFLVVPCLAGVAVFATYLLSRRLASPPTALLAALFIALSPAFLAVTMDALSDVPAMAVWALAFWCVLGQRGSTSVASGLLVSIAILIRPNLVVLAGPMALWLLFRGSAVRALIFAAATVPGIATIAWLNASLYGSPLSSGYGSPDALFAWGRVVPNLGRYLGWYIESQSPVGLLGMAALVLPLRRLWPGVRDRSVFVLMAGEVLILWLLYLSYFIFEDWGYLRFLLPGWPFLMLGLAAVVTAVVRMLPGDAVIARAGVVAMVVAGLGVWQVSFARGAGVFDFYKSARHEALIGPIVRDHTEENSVVMTVERSGSVRYYAGRETLRYDFLDPHELDRDIDWLQARGVHVYALLDDREVEEFRRRFAGQQKTAALDWPKVVYQPKALRLFDFGVHLPSAPNPVVVKTVPAGSIWCIEPEPIPGLSLQGQRAEVLERGEGWRRRADLTSPGRDTVTRHWLCTG